MLRSGGLGRAALGVVLGALGACAAVDDPPAPVPSMGLDEAVFRCKVEPVLARQCSYSACHGLAGSPFRVYSPGKLRATVPADIDAAIAPLTAAEHHANYLSATGFKFAAPDPIDNLLLRKPLAPTAGGYAHGGGAIFPGTDNAEWMAIHDWLAGTGKCP
jgi:hypothetical protein